MRRPTDFQIDLKIDYQALSREIVQQLRGDLSQRELSEKLGYTFNQVGKWESGATQIKWDDFIHLCQVLFVPLEKAFRDCFWTFSSEFNVATTLKALEDTFLSGVTSEKPFQSSLRKWTTGKSAPDLAVVLRIIGTTPASLIGWLSLFIDCERIPNIRASYEKLSVVIDVLFNYPVTAYVYAALQLEAYKTLPFHDETLLAEHAACTRPQLRTALETLLTHGLIAFEGQKFHISSLNFDFSELTHPKLRAVVKHSTLHASRRLASSPHHSPPPRGIINPSYASSRTAAVSTETALEISRLLLSFHNEVGEIVSQDHLPKNNVQVILSHALLPGTHIPSTPDHSSLTRNEAVETRDQSSAPDFEFDLQIDHQSASREIIQQLRGDLSQRELSEKLGYTFNQVGKWESGATQVKWDDFIHLCKAIGVSLEKAFHGEFKLLEPELNAATALKTLSHHFSAGTNQDMRMRAAMKKWLSGKSVPDLAEVLKLMTSRTAMMLTWLSRLVDCSKVPSLRKAYELYLARFQVAFSDPNALLVYTALSLEDYQKLELHDESLLVEHTACSPEQVRTAIQTLHSNGIARFDGKKYIHIPYSESHSANWSVIRESTNLAAQRYLIASTLPDRRLHPVCDVPIAGARVAALSVEAAKQVRDLIWKYQSELGEIVARDNLPKKHVQIVLLHSFRSNTNAPADPDDEVL